MKYDGKFASRWRAKSPDALCAALPRRNLIKSKMKGMFYMKKNSKDVIASIDLAKLSADINRDGKLDDQDVIMYGKVVLGQVEL